MLLVHDTKPPFLDGRIVFTKQAEMVLPVKDATSDMAMIARKGSALMKEVRGKRDENKSRDRFWEMKGTAMGKVTGTTKKEEEEAAEAAEKLRKQAGPRHAGGPPLCAPALLKISVGSGIEDMVSNPVRPIRTVHLENPTDRLADCPTWSRSLSK